MSLEEEFIGCSVDGALRCRQYSLSPSPVEFEADVEPANVPAVFRCAVKNWAAISRWDPFHGGLTYLEMKVGSAAVVEAMVSESGHVFYGALRNHTRVSLPFSSFISLCRAYVEKLEFSQDSAIEQANSVEPAFSEEISSLGISSLEQSYLAQVPIYNAENPERSSLEVLREDLDIPTFLQKKDLSSINFWMNKAQSRSSTHYDPHHNILCVVAGRKRVSLWPPSACPRLYPMPIYGESSNHSAVNIEEPDFSIHPRARDCKRYSELIVLKCGDALFIPEGWFHQVDSDDLTIAVNFWWKSRMMSLKLEHMDGYYLRQIVRRLVDTDMNQMLPTITGLKDGATCHSTEETSEGTEEFGSGCKPQQLDTTGQAEQHGTTSRDEHLMKLDPFAQQKLFELITLVHQTVGVADKDRLVISHQKDLYGQKNLDDSLKPTKECPYFVEHDPVANIFWSLEALDLRKVLLQLVCYFPRTLEALILHMLGATGAEVLTRKFDEMDSQICKEQQDEFYKSFYGVFDDPHMAMEKILNEKELFAYKALSCTLDNYLGVSIFHPRN